MKRLSNNATVIFRYLYQDTTHDLAIPEIYKKLELLSGDEKEVEYELSSLGLIQVENGSNNNLFHKISEYGKRVYES
uniref:Uncharacterized protein n=1 Tax=Roseihalotalea indica TaxID=2867963 RepID=A0AA49GN53_9BACT|nr:hypothetical protein K4G66_01500 [Tunicatimonas sp. TK19036]